MKRAVYRAVLVAALFLPLGLMAPSAEAVCGHCDNYAGVFACYADTGQTGCRLFRCFAYDGEESIIWTYCCEDSLPCVA